MRRPKPPQTRYSFLRSRDADAKHRVGKASAENLAGIAFAGETPGMPFRLAVRGKRPRVNQNASDRGRRMLLDLPSQIAQRARGAAARLGCLGEDTRRCPAGSFVLFGNVDQGCDKSIELRIAVFIGAQLIQKVA
jgi:hypothetical protein